jgi:NADPH:quinone reductase-like Zn-dependent oxidoreductase
MGLENKTGLQLRSLIKKSGELELSLVKVPIPEPAADEVVVRVEATPINPSDLGLLLGAADLKTAKLSGTNDVPVVIATVPESAMKAMAGRLDASMPVGNEGAGVVVKAGASDAAQTLLGKTVAMIGGAMYAQYRCLKAADCLVLAAGTTPTEGASCFVNPLTSLGMVETMRREGHKALVHTAAASNLGQMLNKICLKDQVALVNIVRNSQQEDIATNMPGEVARTSTFALSNVTTSFVLALADKGLRRSLNEDLHLRDGLNVHNGRITYRAVADALKLPYTDANQVLRI